MEGAVPHGLETVESPTVRKARGSHPKEAAVTLVLGLHTVSNATESCANTSNVLQTNNRAEPLSLRRKRWPPSSCPHPAITKEHLAMLFLGVGGG